MALVLVAEDYQKLPKSALGVGRGNDIADALVARGFEVLRYANPSSSGARASLREFAAKAAGADLAIAVLLGHCGAWGGQSFFLPSDSEVQRASDLLSQGLSIAAIAHIAARAAKGGVFFFITSPNFVAPIPGLDASPQVAAEIEKNVFTVFSASPKCPSGQVDATSEPAADALADVFRQPSSALSAAVKAASSGDASLVIGTVPDLTLAALASTVTPPPAPLTQDKAIELETKLASEHAARDLAEKRARDQQARAEQALSEVTKAQTDARKAQADAERIQSDARKAQADAERAAADAKKAAADAEAKLEGERTVREAAEKRAREQQAKAEQAQAKADQAQANALSAQIDARKGQGDTEKALADVRRALADSERNLADARRSQTDAQTRLETERAARETAEKWIHEQQAKTELSQADARKTQVDLEKSIADARRAQQDAEGKLAAERTARDNAEKRAREQQAKAEQIQSDLSKAQADAKRAQAEFAKALADARRTSPDNDRFSDDQASRWNVDPSKPTNETPPINDPQLGNADHFVTGLDPSGDNWLALKAAPNIHSNRLLKMPAGTPLEVLGREGAWLKIRLQNGTEGWAEAQYIGCCRISPAAE
jgi:hypothetical protein